MIISNNHLNIIYVGLNGFPYGYAAVRRQTLISRGLVEQGAKVTILCRKGVHSTDLKIPPEGKVENIAYIYTSGSNLRPSFFLERNLSKIKGFLREFWIILKKARAGEIDIALISTMRYEVLLYYTLLGKMLRFKTVLSFDELNSSIPTRNQLGKVINDRLFEKHGLSMLDCILPISHYLLNLVEKKLPSTSRFHVPIVAEFDLNQIKVDHQDAKVLLYCGSATYLEVIKFVTDAFQIMKTDVELHLVINGNPVEMKAYHHFLGKLKAEGKKCPISYSNLDFQTLTNKYREASILLIPLRDTIQDKARFPHKIGEYMASGTPMVTTNYGEVRYYLKDNETAFIAGSYQEDLFARRIDQALADPKLMSKVGKQGQAFASKNFNYRIHGHRLINHFNTLI